MRLGSETSPSSSDVSAGAVIGSYRIESVLGRGGTGVVYRATDTKLQRPVAIKFLAEFLADPRARRRFQQEAQTASSLNHPHIVTVHDVGEHSGREYIVSEMVDGGTLRDWAEQEHSWRSVVEMLVGVADALATAHAAKIVHRDVKPANILMTRGGYAKLGDFGLAKLKIDADAQSEGGPNVGHTMTGAVIGTVAYMSPEQAAGKPLDERTDIFSFGVVLYELLSGERPFAGRTELESLQKVIDGTAPPLREDLPEELRFIVEKALAKEPDERYQSMRELVVDLKRVLRRSSNAAIARPDATPPTRLWRYAAYGVALVAVATAAAILGRQRADVAPAPSPEIRFEVAVPMVTDAVSLAMSPDGQSIVFEGASEEQSRLWLHSFASLATRALPGTESASFPFWSPDGKSIGFFADGKLKRLDVETGLVRTLADAAIGRGGAWGRDGTIVFSPGTVGPLFSVAALGGDARPLTRLEATQAGHRFPQFLPNGEHLLYYATGSGESRGVMIAARDGTDARRLFDSATAAELVSNHLIFSRQGALYDQPFDSMSRELVGNAVTMAERVAVDSSVYRLALSASSVGSIAYRRSEVGQRQFKWFDREGKVVGRAGDPFESSLSPAMSTDGRSIAFQSSVNDNQDIWLLDLTSGNRTRFTFDPGIDFAPLWSPDGSRILFSSNRSGPFDLYERPSSGAGAETLVLKTALNKFAVDWSSDGRYVLYTSDDPESGYDIWALPMDGNAEPFPVVRTPFQERDGQFSPDGHWIAYQSNDSGRWEVYVQPVRDAAARRQVSKDGGEQVRWRGDGAELFYLGLDGKLMAVPLRFDSKAAAVEIGAPKTLFASRMGRVSNRAQYIVSPDGSRFLTSSIVEEATRSPITVVLDWNNQR